MKASYQIASNQNSKDEVKTTNDVISPCQKAQQSIGGLAQLARAPALQAGGQRFESVILHLLKEIIDMLETQNKTFLELQ